MNGDHATALERLKTFVAAAAMDDGPSHAKDIALMLELLQGAMQGARYECMRAVCRRCWETERVFRIEHRNGGHSWVHAPNFKEAQALSESGDESYVCRARGIRDLPEAA